MPQISSPTRRVLGEKDKNASLRTSHSPAKGFLRNASGTENRSDRVKSLPVTTPLSPDSSIGRKRNINEVEEVEVQERREGPKSPESDKPYHEHRLDLDDTQSSLQSFGLSKTGADTGMTSFCATQEGQQSLEEHFEMPQEEHAVPMPHSASQPPHLGGFSLIPPIASQDSVGMSTFINFGGSDGSQRSDGLEMIEEGEDRSDDTVRAGDERQIIESSQPDELDSEERQRRSKLDEAAARLRTRLQLAYFKVQTNQTAKPLSRLQLPQSKRGSLSPPLMSTPIAKDPSSALAAQEAMEARVSAFRAQATAQVRPPTKALNSLPFPSIQPTAFSARFAEEAPPFDRLYVPQARAPVIQIPSSPPISHTSTEALSFDRPHFQDGDDVELPHSSVTASTNVAANDQLSSPPESHNGDRRSPDEDKTPRPGDVRAATHPEVGESGPKLISSMVKDEAADGLLRLRRSS